MGEWPGFRDFPLTHSLGEGVPERWAPSIDIAESDQQYVVTVELAGANRDDVNVEVQDGVLTVRGEKRNEREERNEERRYIERTYGSFRRSFTLPANANGDDVRAQFRDGVLSIEIPKREEEKPKTIKVH
jgi:HSP20 family protein